MSRSVEKIGLPLGAVVWAGLLVLIYACAYCECVRAPRVSLHSWNWPYYAVGDNRICLVHEIHLPARGLPVCPQVGSRFRLLHVSSEAHFSSTKRETKAKCRRGSEGGL